MNKKRKIDLIIEGNCSKCPYCQHILHPQDPGYDCEYPDSEVHRIVDRWDIYHPYNKNPKGWPLIPDGCPLPTI